MQVRPPTVIARSEATWQSVTPAAGHGEEQRLGRIRKSATDLPKVVPGCQVLLRGERIATPVCALARNDMQKTDTRVRLQGRHARANLQLAAGLSGSARLHSLKPAMFLYVIARSEATWQSVTLAVQHDGKQYFGRMRKRVRICPNSSQLAEFFCGENGLPRLVAPKSAMPSSLGAPLPAKGTPLRGPRHWFAMTC